MSRTAWLFREHAWLQYSHDAQFIGFEQTIGYTTVMHKCMVTQIATTYVIDDVTV